MAVISAEQAGGPNVVKFLDLVAFSEGTSTEEITQNDGYDCIVTGLGPDGKAHEEIFTDYSDHPFAKGRPPKVIRENPLLESTASGRYQILCRFFEAYKTQLKLTDFSPLSQDIVAIQQMKERGAVALLQQGNISQAIVACKAVWASLPGNNYGQGGKSMSALLAWWEAH